MAVVLYLIYLFGVPALVMFLSTKWKWIDRVSPMAVLYVIGLLVANLTPCLRDAQLASLNDTIGSVCVPLAIPLMLMSCSITHLSAGKMLKAFFSGLTAIIIVSLGGYFLFRGESDPRRFAQVCAVSLGIYTGGIPNMGAIAQGVGMDSETYLYLTSYDLIATGLYLVFVICFGKPVFRKLLPAPEGIAKAVTDTSSDSPEKEQPHEERRYRHAVLTLLLTVAAVAIAYFASTLFSEELATPMLILILTTLSIGATLLPPICKANLSAEQRGSQPLAFSLGLYCVYVFCFSIANACDVRQMDLAGSLNILWFVAFVIFGSLVLQILFAKMLKIDSDTTLVSSVSLINSPPFVPMVAAILKNKELIVPGIAIGLLGYMVGNYLGISLFLLLIH